MTGSERPASETGPAAHIVSLDASTWTSLLDFYEETLTSMKAPRWLGRNVNALWEALVQGGFECIPPPIQIVVRNTALLAANDVAHLTELAELVRSGCDDAGMDPGSRIYLLPHGAS